MMSAIPEQASAGTRTKRVSPVSSEPIASATDVQPREQDVMSMPDAAQQPCVYWGATLHGKRKYGGSHGNVCQICGNRGNEHQEPCPTELLLCDYCPFAAHYRCINEPPIYKVPSGDWSCARCNRLYHVREQKRQAEKQRVREINEKRRHEAMEARKRKQDERAARKKRKLEQYKLDQEQKRQCRDAERDARRLLKLEKCAKQPKNLSTVDVQDLYALLGIPHSHRMLPSDVEAAFERMSHEIESSQAQAPSDGDNEVVSCEEEDEMRCKHAEMVEAKTVLQLLGQAWVEAEARYRDAVTEAKAYACEQSPPAVLPEVGQIVWAMTPDGGWGLWPGRIIGSSSSADSNSSPEQQSHKYVVDWMDGSSDPGIPLHCVYPFEPYLLHNTHNGSNEKNPDFQENVFKAVRELMKKSSSALTPDQCQQMVDVVDGTTRRRFKQKVGSLVAILGIDQQRVDRAKPYFHPRPPPVSVEVPHMFSAGQKVVFWHESKLLAARVVLCQAEKNHEQKFLLHAVDWRHSKNANNWVRREFILPFNKVTQQLLGNLNFFVRFRQMKVKDKEKERRDVDASACSAALAEAEQHAHLEEMAVEATSCACNPANTEMNSASTSGAGVMVVSALRRTYMDASPDAIKAIRDKDIGVARALFARTGPPPACIMGAVIKWSTAEMLRALLELGGSENARVEGEPLLNLAVEAGAQRKVAVLLDFNPLFAKNRHKMHALHFAARSGNAPIMKMLLEYLPKNAAKKKFVDTRDDQGWTPLHWCATPEHEYLSIGTGACAELLLDHGATMDLQDMKKRTALWWAACRGNSPIIQLLLQRGANKDWSQYAAFCRDISMGISKTKVQIVPRPGKAAEHFAGYRNFVYIEHSIGNPATLDRKCCACKGPCTVENGCPCAKRNKGWLETLRMEPYQGPDIDRLHFDEPGCDSSRTDHFIINECMGSCGCSHKKCQLSKVRTGLSKKLELRWHDRKGWCVHTLEDIGKGEFVISYAGKYLSSQEMSTLEAKRSAEGIITTYLIEAPRYSIDGTEMGNVSRFFNHSCDPCLVPRKVDVGRKVEQSSFFAHFRPNASVFTVLLSLVLFSILFFVQYPTTAFFAKCDICAGTELTWSYTAVRP